LTRPVTIVIQAGGTRAELEPALAALLGELEWRAAGDEVLLLDTSGTSALGDWAAQRFPPPATFERASCELRTLALARGTGDAGALRAAVSEAAHALVFLMAPGLHVRAGFLEPLCAALEDPRTFAAVPFLRTGESAVEPRWLAGALDCAHVAAAAGEFGFLRAAACLVRRDELLARGLDALFEPGEWLARDLGWRARRDGRALVRVAGSTVELPAASTEVNALEDARARLLFTWKHLDGEALWREHLGALLERTLRAAEEDQRDELVALALALEELPALTRSRPAGAARLRFAALLAGGAEGHERQA